MVLEQFLDNPHVKRHASFILFLSIVYVFFAYGIAYLFFNEQMSLAAVFTLTILLLPSLYHIHSLEEKIERKTGLHHFLRNHRPIMQVYVFAFIGIVAGLVMIGAVFGTDYIYSYQIEFLTAQQHIGEKAVADFAAGGYTPVMMDVLGLFSQNLSVVLIAFALSVFYGAGAVFLIIFNASLFSAILFYFMESATKLIPMIMFIHFIPEIAGFLLAGTAGCILSVALIKERYNTKYFKNVVKNTVLMLALAIALVFVAAVLEIYVSGALLHSLISF